MKNQAEKKAYKEQALKVVNLINQFNNTLDESLKNDLQKQIKTEGEKLKGLEGPIAVHLTAPNATAEVVNPKEEQPKKQWKRSNEK